MRSRWTSEEEEEEEEKIAPAACLPFGIYYSTWGERGREGGGGKEDMNA